MLLFFEKGRCFDGAIAAKVFAQYPRSNGVPYVQWPWGSCHWRFAYFRVYALQGVAFC